MKREGIFQRRLYGDSGSRRRQAKVEAVNRLEAAPAQLLPETPATMRNVRASWPTAAMAVLYWGGSTVKTKVHKVRYLAWRTEAGVIAERHARSHARHQVLRSGRRISYVHHRWKGVMAAKHAKTDRKKKGIAGRFVDLPCGG